MTKQRTKAVALIAAGVVSGGILTATFGAHAADNADSSTSAGTSQVRDHRGPGGPRGGFFRGGDLAKALGISQDKLDAALKAIRDDVKPTSKPDGPPSDAERTAREAKFAAALAKELGLSEAKVKAALDEVRTAHEADRRDDLKDRLAAAVKAGKLTSDDRASVLKAFDAGVLGGPRP